MKITDLKDYTVLSNSASTPAPEASVNRPEQPLANKISDFLGAKGLTDLAGSQMAKFNLAIHGNMDAANRVSQPSVKEVLGSTAQFGSNFIPGAGIGAGLGKKVAVGALTGYGMDVGSKLQQNKPVAEAAMPGVGTAIGAAFPLGGAGITFANKVLGRLFKGLGSGLSGVSSDTIQKIVDNPEFAQQASERLATNGNDRVLEDNARAIVNGVSKIRQEARGAYGQGLGELKAEDINPQTFRQSIQPVLDNFGSALNSKTNERTFSNIEFSEPTNIQKASNLIDQLSTTDLDGLSLRNLINKIEGSKFKTAKSDERLSFNAFLGELANGVKEAVNSSTDKLKDINTKFSADMQLAEAVQNIFGKVNFKNLSEVVRASQKLESMFSQKGLAPEVVDNFLERIGIDPNKFKTTEAVRQIDQKSSGANSTGLSVGEIVREATSAIVTPEMVKNISVTTGLAKEKLDPLLKSLSGLPSALQKVVIQALLQNQQ